MAEQSVVPILLKHPPSAPRTVKNEDNGYDGWAEYFVKTKINEMQASKRQDMYWSGMESPCIKHPDPHFEPIDEKGTPEYKAAFFALSQGRNVCILGPGGTGKSQFIHWAREAFMKAENSVVVTASTANAAFLLGGITLHRYTGIPVYVCNDSYGDLVKSFDTYVKHLTRAQATVNNIVNTNLWICDEISMLSPRVFVLIDLAFRFFRNQPGLAFGGCYFLWSGDFLYIPPVVQGPKFKRGAAPKNSYLFLFLHDAWYTSWLPWIIPFTTNKRSRQQVWSDLLARVRMGRPSAEDIDLLKSRTVSSLRFRGELDTFLDDVVTHIYPTNADVERENMLARAKLPGSDHVFYSTFAVTFNVEEEWSERYESLYDAWRARGGCIQEGWNPAIQKHQHLCLPTNPWYMVLARYVRQEMGFFSPGKFVHGQARAVPTDEECVQAITNQALKFLQENRLPTHQTFRLGEKVRLTVNLAYSMGLVNGLTGRVAGFCMQSWGGEWYPNWSMIHLKKLKRMLNSTFASWYYQDFSEEGADEHKDEQDLWTQCLMVKSRPRTVSDFEELHSARVAFHPVDASFSFEDPPVSPLGQVRALWYGSVALDAVQDMCEGDFVWTDEVDASDGLPVIEWSNGLKTVLPCYDWSLDWSGLVVQQKDKKKPVDRWQLHLFALPLKPAHAMTYHDCQGQTCNKVLLGNVSRLFSENMLYVGLSRAPALENVALSDDFQEWHIKQHKDALEFFDMIDGTDRGEEIESEEPVFVPPAAPAKRPLVPPVSQSKRPPLPHRDDMFDLCAYMLPSLSKE